MIVHQIPVGGMLNFTYAIRDEGTGEAIIVDPSWDLDRIQDVIAKNDMTPKYIVNTHHHFDHTLGNETLSRSTGAPIIQHPSSGLPHDIAVGEGDTIRFGESSLEVLHTPGHSQDSICLVGDGKIFTGDTLFVGSCGRVDLPGGDASQLYHSLRRLAKMEGSLVVYPGHHYGDSKTSTISDQVDTNPVLYPRTEGEFLRMLGAA